MQVIKMVVTVFGILLILGGVVFFLQGINVITIPSYMRGDPQWAINGGVMFAIGAVLIVAANWKRMRGK